MVMQEGYGDGGDICEAPEGWQTQVRASNYFSAPQPHVLKPTRWKPRSHGKMDRGKNSEPRIPGLWPIWDLHYDHREDAITMRLGKREQLTCRNDCSLSFTDKSSWNKKFGSHRKSNLEMWNRFQCQFTEAYSSVWIMPLDRKRVWSNNTRCLSCCLPVETPFEIQIG